LATTPVRHPASIARNAREAVQAIAASAESPSTARQKGSPMDRSIASSTSAERVGSNRLVCNVPACAEARQCTWRIGSPGS
jgi:hypothetical protein